MAGSEDTGGEAAYVNECPRTMLSVRRSDVTCPGLVVGQLFVRTETKKKPKGLIGWSLFLRIVTGVPVGGVGRLSMWRAR